MDCGSAGFAGPIIFHFILVKVKYVFKTMDFSNKTRIMSLTKKRISDPPFVYDVKNRPFTLVPGVNW